MKYCPLTYNNPNVPPQPCNEKSCAWWNSDREKCSVAVIAQDAAYRLFDADRVEERTANMRKRDSIPDYDHERAMGRL